MRILAGDIGGTKTLVAIFEVINRGDAPMRELRRHRFSSGEHPDLNTIVDVFLNDNETPLSAATFAVAGPVQDGVCRTTNLPWVVDSTELASRFSIPYVTLLNDFEAVAFGIQSLRAQDLAVIQDVPPRQESVRAVIGAGTGLGQAILAPCAGGWRVLGTEGGHTDFAPRNALEIELLRFMLGRHERVSWERLVSGPGILALYDFLLERGDINAYSEVQAARQGGDPTGVIGEAAVLGRDAGCRKVVELFLSLYGAEAGNLALKTLPYGGLYIAGGIAPKLLPLFKEPFMPAFLTKGRMSPLLHDVPVSVITNSDVGLLGAAAVALQYV